MKLALNKFLDTNPKYTGSFQLLLRAISTLFGINIKVYCPREYYSIEPDDVATLATANIYFNGCSFDSIVSSSITSNINDPHAITNNQEIKIKVSTWNLNGSFLIEKQLMIDYELKSLNISVACVQETHLRSHLINSPNYKWVLGPQGNGRASRGLGFIVANWLYSSIQAHKFVTPNIGYLVLRLPYMPRNLYIVNVHKMSEGSCNSSHETGRYD